MVTRFSVAKATKLYTGEVLSRKNLKNVQLGRLPRPSACRSGVVAVLLRRLAGGLAAARCEGVRLPPGGRLRLRPAVCGLVYTWRQQKKTSRVKGSRVKIPHGTATVIAFRLLAAWWAAAGLPRRPHNAAAGPQWAAAGTAHQPEHLPRSVWRMRRVTVVRTLGAFRRNARRAPCGFCVANTGCVLGFCPGTQLFYCGASAIAVFSSGGKEWPRMAKCRAGHKRKGLRWKRV